MVLKLSKNEETLENFTSSGLVYRLFSISTYHVAKEVRLDKVLLDANFHLMDSFSHINILSYKALSNLLTYSVQASMAYGISNYDILLKDLDNTYVNNLKDSAGSLKLQNPKKIEFFLNSMIEFLSDYYVISLLKSKLQEDIIHGLREYVAGNCNTKFYLMNKEIREEKRKKAEKGIRAITSGYHKDHVSLEKPRLSAKIVVESEIQIHGIYLSSFIRNPISVSNPLGFIDEVSSQFFVE